MLNLCCCISDHLLLAEAENLHAQTLPHNFFRWTHVFGRKQIAQKALGYTNWSGPVHAQLAPSAVC